jgi:PD-(D/E)XK endonuclease
MKPRTTEAPRKPVHRNTKRTGELSEAAFLLKAETLGFHLAKPWGDSERYDFILDTGSRLWRVQLKCTQVLRAARLRRPGHLQHLRQRQSRLHR